MSHSACQRSTALSAWSSLDAPAAWRLAGAGEGPLYRRQSGLVQMGVVRHGAGQPEGAGRAVSRLAGGATCLAAMRQALHGTQRFTFTQAVDLVKAVDGR